MKQWYYAGPSGETVGPMDYERLRELARTGVINGQTYVFEEGGAEWKTLAEVQKAMLPPVPKAPSIPLHVPAASATPGILEAQGIAGKLHLEDGRIRIIRKGVMAFMTHGMKGDKEIYVSQITSIQFKPAGHITSGYIQFSFMGGRETKGGLFDATKDENTVMFTKPQQPAFEHIKAAIDRQHSTSKGAPNGTHATAHLDELERLADLKAKGIITQDDFDAKKRQLLGL